MKYDATMKAACATVEERGKLYGDIERTFTRSAILASVMLHVPITPYMVVKIFQSVKQARLAGKPAHTDSTVDSINYEAFAAFLADRPLAPELAAVHKAIQSQKNTGVEAVDHKISHSQENTGSDATDLRVNFADLERRLTSHVSNASNE